MKNLIFLDTETTGKGPDDRILEVAFRWGTWGNGDQMLMQRCKPPVPIDLEAMATHHVTERMVSGLPPFNETNAYTVLEGLSKPEAGSVVVAHNAVFDLEMLKREGLNFPKYICTLKVARALCPELPSHKLQYLRYALDLQVEGEAHSAAGDIQVLEKIFERLLHLAMLDEKITYGRTDLETMAEMAIDWMQKISTWPSTLLRLQFGKYKGELFETVDRGYLEWLVKQQDVDEDVMHTAKYWLHNR